MMPSSEQRAYEIISMSNALVCCILMHAVCLICCVQACSCMCHWLWFQNNKLQSAVFQPVHVLFTPVNTTARISVRTMPSIRFFAVFLSPNFRNCVWAMILLVDYRLSNETKSAPKWQGELCWREPKLLVVPLLLERSKGKGGGS
jgi:hypothetical protein